ncbi:DHH family phosphoesterase [Streptobacillus moniliformis]|uniref:Phosphoesterase RecJ domain protein n=2 Tax=Streptobacillus moniliformis TaxID=34105 RepID=D1AYS2_STRM9|nr:bifunctional oligoribonuclease/PAP phosphatase NrnA [Streptobacillus moniliformis]ACZ01448.1 phosphoesterase RecJ domain protein [Streptobacillus moniliformis DSM 12112]AVL43545.1 bifunctional oligoribonuclease/PAP phosphatase NrnA [Streptobacillus moniliformis]SQA13391.1 Bifunctional oligoribonuclease and PAP phosphatase nrnA [Streptobacillus moniliformis]
MKRLFEIKEKIDKYDNIILSAHVNPDGDAFGALFAFKFMIEKYNKNKKVDIVIQYELPRFIYKFDESKYIKNDIDENVELVIMLDTANIDRAAINKEVFNLAKETINIDHHISNSKYLNINYVEDISSTCELLYKFLDVFNIELDEKIAKFMYLGIINDTGNFRHSNVTENTFDVASKLMKVGVDNREITNILFSKSREKVKVFGKTLVEYKYYEDLKFAFFYISQNDMKNMSISEEDTDGISELLLSIEDVDIALFVREDKEAKLKGSFRSKNIDVNKLASRFNGGGHVLAAGFRFSGKLEEILEIVLKELRR